MSRLCVFAVTVLALCAVTLRCQDLEEETNNAAEEGFQPLDETAHHIEKRSSSGGNSGRGFSQRGRFRSRGRSFGRGFRGGFGGRFGFNNFLGAPFFGGGQRFGVPFFGNSFRPFNRFFGTNDAIDLNIVNNQRLRGSRVNLVDTERINNILRRNRLARVMGPPGQMMMMPASGGAGGAGGMGGMGGMGGEGGMAATTTTTTTTTTMAPMMMMMP